MKKQFFYILCVLSVLWVSCGEDEKIQENVKFKGLSLKKTLIALEGEWADPYSTEPTQTFVFTNEGLKWRKFELEDIYGFTYLDSSTTEIWLPVDIQDGILTLALNDWANPLPLSSEKVTFHQLVRIR